MNEVIVFGPAEVVAIGVASSADFAGDVTVGVASSADLAGDVTVGVWLTRGSGTGSSRATGDWFRLTRCRC